MYYKKEEKRYFTLSIQICLFIALLAICASYIKIRNRLRSTWAEIALLTNRSTEHYLRLSRIMLIVIAASLVFWQPAFVVYTVREFCHQCQFSPSLLWFLNVFIWQILWSIHSCTPLECQYLKMLWRNSCVTDGRILPYIHKTEHLDPCLALIGFHLLNRLPDRSPNRANVLALVYNMQDRHAKVTCVSFVLIFSQKILDQWKWGRTNRCKKIWASWESERFELDGPATNQNSILGRRMSQNDLRV